MRIFEALLPLFLKIVHSARLPTQCKTTEYYDPVIYECASCPANQVPSSDKLSCICAPDSIISYSKSTSLSTFGDVARTLSCVKCPNSQIASFDRTTCLGCNNGISKVHGDCDCPNGWIIEEKNQYGNYLTQKICTQCPIGAFPGPVDTVPIYYCLSCPDRMIYNNNTIPWSCECDVSIYEQFGNECLPKIDVKFIRDNFPDSQAFSVSMSDSETNDPLVVTKESINSDAMKYYYMKSGYKCLKENDIKSCQTLANLCVLQMYDLQTPPCRLYKYLNDLKPKLANKNEGARDEMPWIMYYGNSTEILNNTERIKFVPTFDPNDPKSTHKLDLFISMYDLEGNYLGIERVTNHLNLCSNDYEDGIEFMDFGTGVNIQCNIDIFRFLRKNYTTYFYELYLYDQVTKEYIDVPLRIDNVPNEKGSWSPNNTTNPSDWLLSRRFFMVDNIAGVEPLNGVLNPNIDPKAIRYAHIFKLKVVLQNREDPRIFVPYFEIFYKTKKLILMNDIPQSIAFFQSAYVMNIDYLIYVFQSIFITLNIIIGVHIIIRMYSWYNLNPPSLSPDNHCCWMVTTFFFTLFQLWGLYIFWFSWLITGYFFIFYKLQYRVFLLLYPTIKMAWYDNNRPFDISWGIGCACYFFYLCYRLYQQSIVDIFFIDWEHDKNILVKNAEQRTPVKYKGVWRVLLLANQLNQLQIRRKINIEFAFAILVFLWFHLGWEVHGHDSATLKGSRNAPEVYLMRHCLSTFILIIVGIILILARYVVDVFLPSRKIMFMDLLSVSNISLFILDSSLHGYYVHGQSPSGKADTSIEELLNFLDEESQGKGKNRNLVDDGSQCYELYISYKMRKSYDGLFAMQAETMFSTSETKDRMINQSRMNNLFKVLPKNFPFRFVMNLKDFMNSELKEKILKISNQANRYILKKSLGQRFFNLPPVKLAEENSEDMILYKDRNASFDSVLLFGIDWEWYILNIYTFQMWMLTIDSLAQSIMLTLICDKILISVRSFVGERNLSKKSIIDNKFFV